jgi:translation elongation factor EF-Tu-like GTPase
LLEITIESVFHLKGYGTVLAGRVLSGQVSVGDSVEVRSPTNGVRSVVAGLESHRRLLAQAAAGTEVGVLLRDFAPESLNDGLQRDESGGWRVVSLRIRGVPKAWWRLW